MMQLEKRKEGFDTQTRKKKIGQDSNRVGPMPTL